MTTIPILRIVLNLSPVIAVAGAHTRLGGVAFVRPAVRGRHLLTALLAVLGLALSACGGGSAVPGPGARLGQRLDVALPSAITDAVLVSSSGQRFTLASLRGKIVVVSDAMTLCQETCPLDTANVVAAARAAAKAGLGHRIVFLSITIDPKRDTPVQLAAYRKLFAPAPTDWINATGSPSTLAAFWKAFGVYIQRVPDHPPLPRNWRTGQPLTYDLTHSDEVFFLDERGHERFILDGAPHLAPGTAVPAKLYKFMTRRGHRNVNHPSNLAWTLPQELDVLSWLSDQRIPGAATGG
jgi:protein SCO1/2